MDFLKYFSISHQAKNIIGTSWSYRHIFLSFLIHVFYFGDLIDELRFYKDKG